MSSVTSLLGSEALADIKDPPSPTDPIQMTDNSQTMSLLQADFSSVLALSDKDGQYYTDDGVQSDTTIQILSESALLPSVSSTPLSSGKTGTEDSSFDQISIYVVRKGDSISQIAEMFDVSVNTVLWANNLSRRDVIKEGEVLFILPVDGVKHEVRSGETLKSIAKKYSVELEDIAGFNGLAVDAKLAVGEELIIPDGEIAAEETPSVRTLARAVPPRFLSESFPGYYVNPVPRAVRTQKLHGKNGVDLAASIGTPVYAAASGPVLIARMGWNGGYGGLVVVEHSNGTKTLYGHLSRLGSVAGQVVSQGEVIGYVGNTGRVRPSRGGNGAHLHFEVHGAKNPGVDGSWAR